MRHVRIGLVLTIALVAGCSRKPELVQVSGAVKVDGQPAEGVQISFWPADSSGNESRNRFGEGMSGPDGRFELQAFTEKGLEPGEYKVTFSRLVANGKVVTNRRKKTDKMRESLLEKFTKQDSTDVTARVSRDEHEFVFEISSKPK